MKISDTFIKDLFIIEPQVFSDERGWFMETFTAKYFDNLGIKFVQDNQSYSKLRGTLRGLHLQNNPNAQSKLVRCIKGSIYDVAVDLRKNSETYLKWFGVILSSDNKKQLFIPKGFAHGFITLENDTEVHYKVDNYYSKELELGIVYSDSQINISWPTDVTIISQKDLNAPTLKEIEDQIT